MPSLIKLLALLLFVLTLSSCGSDEGSGAPPAPVAPSNVIATAGPGYITVAWQDNSDNETGFVVYRQVVSSSTTTSGTMSELGTVGSNITSYRDNNVDPDKLYEYAVAAQGADGTSKPTEQQGESVRPEPENLPPSAHDDHKETTQDMAVEIDILANDSDPDGDLDTSTITIVQSPVNGTTTLGNNGTVTYTPNSDYTGTDSFTYTVDDNDGATSNVATVTVVTRSTGKPPTIEGFAFEPNPTNIDEPGEFSWSVTETNGDTVECRLDPADGSPIIIIPNCLDDTTHPYTYTHEGDYTPKLAAIDKDGREYRTVLVSVNVPPIADAGSNQSVEVGARVVLDGSGSSDTAGDPLTYSWTLTKPPGSNAQLSVANAVQTSFTADVEGQYLAKLTVSDGLSQDSDDVTVTASPGNLRPIANEEAVTTKQETPLEIDVLANDRDPDSNLEADTVTVARGPNNGTTTINSSGIITYMPDDGFVGEDSFTYTVDDNDGATSNEAEVRITVTPILHVLTVVKAGSGSGTLTSQPTGIDCGGACSAEFAQDTLVVLTLDLDANSKLGEWQGCTSTNGMLCDVKLTADTTVTVKLERQNQEPLANDDSVATKEGAQVEIEVLANDSDPDGSLEPGTVAITQVPSHGTTSVNPDGTVIYTPNSGFIGTDSFKYTVDDNDGASSNEAVVTVEVSKEPQPPIISSFSYAPGPIGQGSADQFSWVISEPDGDSVTCELDPGDGTGAITIDDCQSAPSYSYTYSQVDNYTATLTATDKDGSDTQTTTVNVAPANDNFGASITIAGPSGSTTGSNVNATKEAGEPNHALDTGGASIWWLWSAPSTGDATIDTFGSDFDTLLAIYTGSSVNSLTPVASNDESSGPQSRVTFTAIAGTTYHVAVDGYDGASGSIILNWELTEPERYTLTVDRPSHGTLTASGIDCGSGGSDCTHTYDAGTDATITATADSGYELSDWGGDCNGASSSDNTCNLTMNGDRTASASFTTIPKPDITTPDPSSISEMLLEGQSTNVSVSFANNGNATLTYSISESIADVNLSGVGSSLAPGGSESFTVSLACSSTTDRSGNIVINSNDPDEPSKSVTVNLDCTGTPEISNPTPNPLELSAGVNQSDNYSISFNNSGDAPLTYTASESESWLEITSGASGTVAPGGSANVDLTANCPTTPDDLSTTLSISSNDPDEPSKSVTVNLSCNAASGFTIDILFAGSGFTPARQQVFLNAADRWAEVVSGDLPDASINKPANSCFSSGEPAVNDTIDDLLIHAIITPIDGTGGTLARAGPCWVRTSGSKLPIYGVMMFDSADVANMEGNGSFPGVILHEMGHILGVGTYWDFGSFLGVTYLDYTTNPSGQECDEATSFTVKPTFNGANAIAEFAALGGGDQSPAEDEGSSGTKCGHWDEDFFDHELMTGYSEGGPSMPLSRLTVASLDDIGYSVDLTAANPYNIPACSPNCLMAQDEGRLINEILLYPKGIVTPDGTVVPFRAPDKE